MSSATPLSPVVLYEDPGSPDTPFALDHQATMTAALVAGYEPCVFSANYELFGTADDALEHLPRSDVERPGFWLGFLPSAEQYREVYDAAARRGVRLLNTPDEHLDGLEFDRFAARLGALTPESEVVTDLGACEAVAARLGLPAFVKGAVRSAKRAGWAACVAESPGALRELCAAALADPKSRGRAVVRRLAPLRHVTRTESGFPRGREYRVLTYRGEVLSLGYYWPGDDPLAPLSAPEEGAVCELAGEAARRVGVPLLAVDIGQRADTNEWIVIEVGDAQFAGFSHAPREAFFRALAPRARAAIAPDAPPWR